MEKAFFCRLMNFRVSKSVMEIGGLSDPVKVKVMEPFRDCTL